ncbi:alpha-2-macroglobulin family protein [Xanthobacter sp. TB0139]|uniref:alpha-2-macroglobulin family protein n=1 Tax=Xanthobacter sp. TB0139 TaxID=3459178 RepID=UPI0040390C0F
MAHYQHLSGASFWPKLPFWRKALAVCALAGGAMVASAALAQPQPMPVPGRVASAQSAPSFQKSFQRDDLIEGARRYERQLGRTTSELLTAYDTTRRAAENAMKQRDPRTAATLYANLAMARPQESAAWLSLARALAAITPREGEPEGWRYADDAMAAAYIAYRRAQTPAEGAAALAFIGHQYANRNFWNAALESMKAALALRDSKAERNFYEKIREEHGFRVVDFTVESESAAPRACVQFSQALAGSADFAPFVRMADDNQPALRVDGSQICVEGLKHGARYEVRLRPGLPAANGEKLNKAVSLAIYVRDRLPMARFTGRNYVLPRTGQKGIPVVSVNTSAVKVGILRIGDRALVPTALQGEFRRNLYSYARERLAEGAAVKVWSGVLEVESPLNSEVTTAIPVSETIGALQPGVYVMTAAPDPASLGDGERYGAEATQWFIVSDLGLTAISGEDGVHVLVRGLGGAQPVEGALVKLVARSNEVLGTARTDASGHVRFDPGLSRGPAGLEPEVVIASTQEGDYAFLSLKDSAFDLTDRGVAGRAAPGTLDAFLTPERGVYRSGETVHVTTLVRNAQGRAAADLPVTLILYRPDGVEDRRLVLRDAEVGGLVAELPLLEGAMTGTWRVRAFADPKAPAIGETAFLLEDYVPDRVEFTLTSPQALLSRQQPAQVLLEGRFLFGAPAAGLEVEAQTQLRLSENRKGFEGYRFGNGDDQILPETTAVADVPVTDEKGHAALQVLARNLPRTHRPLEMETLVRLVEAGGRAVQRTIVLPVAPSGSVIGVKPLFPGRVDEGAEARFDVIVAGADDRLLAAPGLTWELSRLETRYQWYRSGGAWDFEPVRIVTRVAQGRLDVGAQEPARLSVPTGYGRYRLDVSGDNLPLTSLSFDAGFAGEGGPDTPDRLELVLEREAYASGDTLNATLTARAAGTATVMVMNEGVLEQKNIAVQPGPNRLTFTVGENWGPGAYLVAFFHRPLDVAAGRMPGRAIGLAWFSVNRAAHTLKVALDPPEQMRPEERLTVPVRVEGLQPGEQAYVTLAAVDVGILNLTGFTPPAPDDVIFGQRRLGMEVRDLYGALINGMHANAGRLRSGGDGMEVGLQASPPTQPPLALFSGIVPVGTDGTVSIPFAIPAFDGTVRLMAMAWSADRLGHGSADVVVRDKVVVLATLPRFLAAGDRSTLNLDLTNVDGPAGAYQLRVSGDGAAGIVAPTGELMLKAGERRSLRLPLEGRAIGPGRIDVHLSGQGVEVARSFALDIRAPWPDLSRRMVRTLEPGESVTVSSTLLNDVLPGSGSVALSVSPGMALDVPALLAELDRYPYGCAEQVTSRALPLLSYNELSRLVGRPLDADAQSRIRDAITRVLAHQGSDGSFGLWGAGGQDVWLSAYVTDFLTRAQEKGFAVPQQAFALALDGLRNRVNLSGPDLSPDGNGLAYALYVLARNGRAPLGDLRYLADARLDKLPGPMARAQVGAGLALLGDRNRAEQVLRVALAGLPAAPVADETGRNDFGSALRDAAAVTVLSREAGFPQLADAALKRMGQLRGDTLRTSTQENAWMVRAAESLAQQADAMRLDVSGAPYEGVLGRTLSRAALLKGDVVVRNGGATPVEAVMVVHGAPRAPEPPAQQGFRLERAYFTLDGQPADPARVQQNQRLAVVLKVEDLQNVPADILLVDYLPAGFEIENPKLVQGGQDGAFAWLDETASPEHVEFRDDRFVASAARQQGDGAFVVAYVVRAVSPGRYAHPPAMVEDMYRPERFARTGTGTVEVTAAK